MTSPSLTISFMRYGMILGTLLFVSVSAFNSFSHSCLKTTGQLKRPVILKKYLIPVRHFRLLSSIEDIFGDVDDFLDYPDDERKPSSAGKGGSNRRSDKRKLVTINSEIDSLAYNCNRDNPEKAFQAEEMLMNLIEEANEGGLKPSVRTFSSVIKAYANAGNPSKAEEILKLMIEYSEVTQNNDHASLENMTQFNEELLCRPNTIIFTNVINAWAQSKERNAARRADEILSWMKQMNKAGIPNVAPNTVTYATCINAWAKGKKVTEKCALRAEELLEEMEEERAKGSDVKPNTVAFTSVINAWGRSMSPKAIDRIQYIFDRMTELSAQGVDEIRPNSLTYNSVMSSYVKNNSPIAALTCEKLLNRMEMLSAQGDRDVAPDTITYNVCINAWARSDDPSSAQHAEHILNRLESRYKEFGGRRLRPNDRSYNSCINAWVKSDSPSSVERAEKILYRMIEASNEGNIEATPNVISFSSVMDAWAKSNDSNKASKTRAMLHKMIDLYEGGQRSLRPSNIAYNTVLNACAFTRNGDKNDALLIAIKTYNELRQSPYCKPDAVSYGTLLKAMNYLVPKGDKLTIMATKLFQECCKDGQCGDLFINNMRKAVPKETFNQLMVDGGSEWSKGNLRPPKEWIRNVKDKRSVDARKGKTRRDHKNIEERAPQRRKFVPQISINVGGVSASDLL